MKYQNGRSLENMKGISLGKILILSLTQFEKKGGFPISFFFFFSFFFSFPIIIFL